MRDMKFTIWEEGAEFAVEQAGIGGIGSSKATEALLQGIDQSIGEDLPSWGYIARNAARGYRASFSSDLPLHPSFEQCIVKLLASKQRDYGHHNILRFGIGGIKVRISDKVCRLRNLLARSEAPRNEAIEDSWLDIVGYSILAIMLENGTFELPLAADVEPEQAPAAQRGTMRLEQPDGTITWYELREVGGI